MVATAATAMNSAWDWSKALALSAFSDCVWLSVESMSPSASASMLLLSGSAVWLWRVRPLSAAFAVS